MAVPLYADTEDEAIRAQLAAQYGGLPEPPPFVVEQAPPEVYNPDRPSTWDAPDSPKVTTLDRARKMEADYMARPPRDLGAEVQAYEDEQTRQALSPYDLSAAAGVASGAAGQRGDSYLEDLLSTETLPSRPNPLRPIRERYHRAMAGDGSPVTELDIHGNVVERQSGLMGQQEFLAEQHGMAQIDEQQAHALSYAQEAGRQQAEIDAAEYRVHQQQMKREQIMHAQQLVMDKLTAASDRVNNAPEIDYDRYWKSQSAGRKFAWGLQAALAGFAGLNPTAALETAINMDVNEQKANHQQRIDGLGARQTEFAAQSSLFQDFRMATGDDEAAELMLRQLRWGQAEAGMKAMAAKEGIPPAILESNILLNEMRQKQAEVAMALDTLLATTPERIGGGTRPLIRGPIRKTMEALRKEGHAESHDLQKMAIELGGKTALQDRAIAGDIEKENVKSEGRARVAQQKETSKQAASLAASVKAEQSAVAIIDDLLALSDKSGGGRPGKFGPIEAPDLLSSDDQRNWDLNKSALKLLVQKWASGAHLSDSQFALVEKMMQDNAWTGGREVQSLHSLRKLMQSVSKASERGYSEPVRQQYHRAADLPGVEASYEPDGEEDPVDVDED